MPRFFIEPSQIGKKDNGERTVLIMGEDALHICKSLRMKAGEKLTVCDKAGTDYICEISNVGENITLLILEEKRTESEPPYAARVFQALVKGDKFDTVVQKAVECGAYEIIPFSTERSIMKLDKKDSSKKTARWQRIAEEAAKQCGRGIIPTVSPVMTFKEAITSAAKSDISLMLYEDEHILKITDALKKTEKRDSISIIIGSEGGFSPKEVEAAKTSGIQSVSLGKRILRTETASSFALACISYELEI